MSLALHRGNLRVIDGSFKGHCTPWSATPAMFKKILEHLVVIFCIELNFSFSLVTSAGGIEEDFIKCLAPTYLGDFSLDGRTLRGI